MPQISKIRIVNFQYNEGKRLIADELYDFESENKGPSDVLFNLANGGGKSVLVQLMMQPIIPKARVAGRRIESFFTKATDHCYVVIEWALDLSKTKLMTGIAMAASDSTGDSDSDRGFQIKYYTFLSDYQNYQGIDNIISLPLSRKENGKFIPASFDDVRNLARRPGNGLERFSSDDSIKWQERLSEYGIVQNEWHMIEKLNSNEDGLSKFFSELKTSDKVIDELIIPRIEEKRGNSKNQTGSKDDSSLETMLISYAKQFARQQEFIKEREVCVGFLSMLGQTKAEAEELWKSKDSLEKCIGSLYAYADALNAEIDRKKEESDKIRDKKFKLNDELRHIQWEKVSAEFYMGKESFERETDILKAAEESKEKAYVRSEAAERKLLLLECAHYYEQLRFLENSISAISEEIKNRENHSESADKLASLKYSALAAIDEELHRILPEIEKSAEEKNRMEASVSELERRNITLQKEIDKAKTDTDKTEAIWARQYRENDAAVENLGIDAFRMLDGKYQPDELKSWQTDALTREKELTDSVTAIENELQEWEERKEAIPQKIADSFAIIKELQAELEEKNIKLFEYRTAEEKIWTVLEIHGLSFALRFTDEADSYLKEQLSLTIASITEQHHKIEATEEAIAAVKRGTLHIPKMLTDYLDGTGLHYTSVEKYLLTQKEKGLLSEEGCMELLKNYPFAAYGVIVDASEAETLCSEAEGRWLPAILPILTAGDLSAMLRGEKSSFKSVAAYADDYFLDNSSYAAGLQNTLNEQRERLSTLESRKKALQKDITTVEKFAAYDQDWEERIQDDKKRSEKAIDEQKKQEASLRKELVDIKAGIQKRHEEEKELHENLLGIRRQLSDFDILLKKLKEEDELYQGYETAERRHREYTDTQKDVIKQKTALEIKLREQAEEWKALNSKKQSLQEGLDKVSGATEAERIQEEWDVLLTRYETLLKAQNTELGNLNDKREIYLREADEKKKEIQKRGCRQDEYAELIYSEESEEQTIIERQSAEEAYQTAQATYMKATRIYGKAEASFESAIEKLNEFGGLALPPNEVGKAFDDRIANLKKLLEETEISFGSILSELSKLQKVQGKAELAIEQYPKPDRYAEVTLDDDYGLQMISLSKKIREWENLTEVNNRKVEDYLKRMSALYGDGSADVKIAIASMQAMLTNETISGDRYFTLCEHIDANMHTTELRISQIDTDLGELNKTKEDVITSCVIQGQWMYEGLQQLSNQSTVKIQGKRHKMLRFDIPESVDENVAKAAINAEIDKGTEEIVKKMGEDVCAESEIRKLAERVVGSRRLLRKYIGLENIILKAYKIDRNPDHSGYRTWQQTQVNNSGAEKFVVYFAVILALMAYTRDQDSDMGEKNNRSVLILDNPFGPISSKHVLEPMFEISRNYKVQMICLSDISKSDIVSCFDLVIRAVVKQFALSTKEQLTHDGNEMIEHGFYRSEQMNIFAWKE